MAESGIAQKSEIPQDVAKMSFEAAMAELEQIVSLLEAGKGKLDDAIRSYERGTALRRHCETKLAEAQVRIDRIVAGPNGVVDAVALDTQE